MQRFLAASVLVVSLVFSLSQQAGAADESPFVILSQKAEEGDARAMLDLGAFFEHGIETPRNFIRAFYWYQKAADAGLAEGWLNVGIAWEIGLGNAGDIKMAAAAYEKAAKLGSAEAMLKLGRLLLADSGAGYDPARGARHLAGAAAKGSADAANILGAILLQGLYGLNKDQDKAYDYFMQAAGAGHLEAIKNIAVIHKNGLGRKADPQTALTWYLVAHKGGYQSDDLDAVIAGLKKELKKTDADKAAREADQWLADFQKAGE